MLNVFEGTYYINARNRELIYGFGLVVGWRWVSVGWGVTREGASLVSLLKPFTHKNLPPSMPSNHYIRELLWTEHLSM